MAYEDRPRRRLLTPIGDERRHSEVEIGKPSLRDRWRRRRRLQPTPSTWYGILLVGLVRFAAVASLAVGLAFLVAVIGGWTNGNALAKVFYVFGSF